MSYANYTISDTDVTTTDIRNATGISTDANVKFSDLFNPAVADINKWSRKKPTDAPVSNNPDNDYKGASLDYSLKIYRDTSIANAISHFSDCWSYKYLSNNFRISHFRGYYSAARSFYRGPAFPSTMIIGQSITFGMDIYGTGTGGLSATKEIRVQDITKASNGASINYLELHPGIIIAKGTSYHLKATSATCHNIADLYERFSMTIANPTASAFPAGNYKVYPVLFEGTPTSAMTGTGVGATTLPSQVTGIIPLPDEPWDMQVYTTPPTPTTHPPYVDITGNMEYGLRPTYNGDLVLVNPSDSGYSSWTFTRIYLTLENTSGSRSTITYNAQTSVSAGSQKSISVSLRWSAMQSTPDDRWDLTITYENQPV